MSSYDCFVHIRSWRTQPQPWPPLLALSLHLHLPLPVPIPAQLSLALPPHSSDNNTQLCLSCWETLRCVSKTPLPPQPVSGPLWLQASPNPTEQHGKAPPDLLGSNSLIIDFNGKKRWASMTSRWPQKNLSNKLFSCPLQLPEELPVEQTMSVCKVSSPAFGEHNNASAENANCSPLPPVILAFHNSSAGWQLDSSLIRNQL